MESVVAIEPDGLHHTSGGWHQRIHAPQRLQVSGAAVVGILGCCMKLGSGTSPRMRLSL